MFDISFFLEKRLYGFPYCVNTFNYCTIYSLACDVGKGRGRWSIYTYKLTIESAEPSLVCVVVWLDVLSALGHASS